MMRVDQRLAAPVAVDFFNTLNEILASEVKSIVFPFAVYVCIDDLRCNVMYTRAQGS
jgi:hypothetical protein